MASRAVDLLIAYRVIKLLVTPFDKQEAFKTGIIDKNGKVLKPNRLLKTSKEKSFGIPDVLKKLLFTKFGVPPESIMLNFIKGETIKKLMNISKIKL